MCCHSGLNTMGTYSVFLHAKHVVESKYFNTADADLLFFTVFTQYLYHIPKIFYDDKPFLTRKMVTAQFPDFEKRWATPCY